MKQNIKYAPLSNFIDINPENISRNYPYNEIEYIDISSVASGYLNEKPIILNLANAPSRAKRIVRENDSILATVRPNLRAFLYITNPKPNTIVSTGFAVLRAKNKVDPRFIYYGITNPIFTGYLTNNAKGTSYPAVDTNIILRGEIPDFSYITQQKIADILSKYDDLIENNRRRIELLEKSARSLYREWFVYLRFPGHEHTPIIDGIPEGWEKKTLAELSDSINYGYTAQSSLESIGTKYLRITDIVPSIIDWESVPFCIISENDLQKFCLREGDILVARTGATVGYAKRIGKLTYNSVFASYLVRFRFNNKLNNVIAGVFMESENYKIFVRNNAGGAAQPNANAKILSSASILVPPKLIQNNFSEIVEAINHQKAILQEQNQKLNQARDLLLPRLMNGEIAV